MKNLYKTVENVQSGDSQAIVTLLQHFEPKMNSLMRHTKNQEQSDMKQELILILIEKTIMYHLDEVPGYEEFTEKNTS